MQIRLSEKVIRNIKKISQKDKKLASVIKKQLKIFENDPKHPSLRTHKLSGNFSSRWSISITRSIRMTYILRSNTKAYFIAIGTHDQVYRK